MQNSALKAWLDSSYLSGANQSWIEQLYEDFLTDPDSVDANWRSTFQQLPGTGVKPDQFHSQTREYFRRLAKDASRYSLTHTASVVTSMRISIRWDCGSKIKWPIWIRLSTI